MPDITHDFDFDLPPLVASEHDIISDGAKTNVTANLENKAGGVNQHNYLVHHDGQFWAK